MKFECFQFFPLIEINREALLHFFNSHLRVSSNFFPNKTIDIKVNSFKVHRFVFAILLLLHSSLVTLECAVKWCKLQALVNVTRSSKNEYNCLMLCKWRIVTVNSRNYSCWELLRICSLVYKNKGKYIWLNSQDASKWLDGHNDEVQRTT